jgi:hypothetical protein
METKKILTIILSVFVLTAVIVIFAGPRENNVPSVEPAAAESATGREGLNQPVSEKGAVRTVVFYFHGDKRCRTCLQIEKSARAAIEDGFEEELKAGELAFRSVNFDEPGSMHYRDDFDLSFGTVVVANYLNGEIHGFTNLEKVWDLVWDDEAFRSYVQEGAREMLPEKPSE